MKARKKKPGIRGVDPEDKKKKKKAARTHGSAAVLKRNPKTGELEATLKDDFGGVSKETIRDDRATAAGTGDGNFNGGPAPRVGGEVKIKKDGAVRGGTKKMVRKARRRVRKSAASPAAKKSARRAYRRM